MVEAMEKAFMAVIGVSLIFLSFSAALQTAEVAKANFTPLPTLPVPIYLRSDGSIDPSTAPLQRVGDIYKLASNINNTIEVQRSNIVIDGNGFTITNPTVTITQDLMIPIGWLPGISLLGVSNVTIFNVTLQNCITGIRVENSTDIMLNRNAIKGGIVGIAVFSSTGISIINNNIQSSSTGINFLPSNPNAIDSYEIKIEQNLISGTSKGISGKIINSQITDNNLTGIGTALNYAGSNNIITRNIFQYSDCGIWFIDQLAVNSTIFRNDFNHNSRNVVIPFIKDPPFNYWDNGTTGNYWSDYNGVDSNGDGIGDSPYVLLTTYYDYVLNKNVTLEGVRDNFPLMRPIRVENAPVITSQSPNPTPSPSTTLSPTPTPSLNPTPLLSEYPTQSISPSLSPIQTPTIEPSLTASPTEPVHSLKLLPYSLIITVVAALIAAVVAGMLVYYREKRGEL
ncbi:MAG: NosD domain-containing protein [Candidatus Bathyarchaeia archaeon]